MFSQKQEKIVDRQARHVSFLSQFIHDVEHVSGAVNIVPDAPSRLELSAVDQELPNIDQWATNQTSDTELQSILSGAMETSLVLHSQQTANGPVYFDVVNNQKRLFVPKCHRHTVFTALRGQANCARLATCRLIKARFVWFGMYREIRR